jgi:hypothetical protein
MDPVLASEISKTARKLGVSESDYVSKVLSIDIMLKPLSQKIDGIAVSKILFQRIISQLNSTSLEIIASEIAQKNAPYAFELLGLELNQDSLIWFLREILQNMSWFSLEEVEFETYKEYKLFHTLDGRWSLFLKSCLNSLFKLIHEKPDIVLSERVVRIAIQKEGYLHLERDFRSMDFN